jgi:hypothetical protein
MYVVCSALNILNKVLEVKRLNVRNYCHQNIFISLHLNMHLMKLILGIDNVPNKYY